MGNEKNQAEAAEKLAMAMDKLADKLERFLDPVVWQKVFSDAMGFMFQIPQLPAVPSALPTGISLRVELSPEERDRIASRLYETMQPQLQEFNEFVRDSLKEMPSHRLEQAGKLLKEGKVPRLRRRGDCVYLDFGEGENFYLGL